MANRYLMISLTLTNDYDQETDSSIGEELFTYQANVSVSQEQGLPSRDVTHSWVN
jgi:hypothetical protein